MKRQWPDGIERVCSGSVVRSGDRSTHAYMIVNELPSEVKALMDVSNPETMLELHHHGDPEVRVYVRNEDIISIDARWDKVEDID